MKLPFFLPILFSAVSVIGQNASKMDFEQYNPPSTLVVPGKKISKARFPFIDVHNHQFRMPEMDLKTLVKDMDALNMKVMVNLSGQSGESLKRSVANVKEHYPKRFIVFANVDFKNVGEAGWGGKCCKATGRRCEKRRKWFKNI